MHIYNRPYRFNRSNSETHSNDIYNIYQTIEEDKRPKILGLICDNGPDFNPASHLVFYNMGRLWRDLNLDQFFVCSYAPRSSRYNPIELVWGSLSQALAQITLVSDHAKYDLKNEQDLKRLFSQAEEELEGIWSQTKYAGKNIRCNSVIPNASEEPYHNYNETQDVLKHGKKHILHNEYRTFIKFLLSHCKKRPYYLQFSKCSDQTCNHCMQNPIETDSALRLLDQFDNQLPFPILLKEHYSGQHFPSFVDLINNSTILTDYNLRRKEIVDSPKKMRKSVERALGSLHQRLIRKDIRDIANNNFIIRMKHFIFKILYIVYEIFINLLVNKVIIKQIISYCH